MALTRIEYGSLASSAVMNSNFDYLDDCISNVSASLSASTASINSNIATINSSITNLSESIEDDLSQMQAENENIMSQNGLYITQYVSGTSWYREYFSDSEKTTRVWLEQGGYGWDPVFIKTFGNTNYTSVITGCKYQNAVRIVSKTSSGMTFEQWQTASGQTSGDSVWWFVCGI